MSLGPLIIDVEGFALTAEESERLMHPWVGGVILFSRNFESVEQLKALTAAIHRLRPLLISVDHEGGRIQRFREGFTALPSFQSLGEGLSSQPSAAALAQAMQNARQAGLTLARELRAVGVDYSYTPVLDLNHGQSAVIGDRSLHRDPALVTMLASAVMHGLRMAGFHNCGKHFPGHGWAQADSHLALPVDDRPLETILSDDASPYAWLGRGDAALSAVMPAHIRYTAVDDQPAGFSRTWLTDILKGRLGFEGVVISDDLAMAGAAIYEDVADRAQAAFEAGCDATLICNRPDLSIRALDELPRRMPDFLTAPARRSLARLLPDA
ncbi:MAG: beta-N-acetylhexosaminidase [Burkholderiaceae bacterium]